MESLSRNLRYTIRMLWKSPGLTITVLLTLALGIGANIAIFTLDYATLLAPLPYPQPDQLVVVWSKKSPRTSTDSRSPRATTTCLAAHSFSVVSRSCLGRDFLPEEGPVGKDYEAILTHKLWSHLGADPKLVGHTMRINSEL
jgi:putative ABC transport system permease protein